MKSRKGPRVLARQVLHTDEVLTVDLAELVRLDDVRMIEAGRDDRLIQEHLAELRLAREVREDTLQRDDLLEAERPELLREIQPCHAAFGEDTDETILADRLLCSHERTDIAHVRGGAYEETEMLSRLPPAAISDWDVLDRVASRRSRRGSRGQFFHCRAVSLRGGNEAVAFCSRFNVQSSRFPTRLSLTLTLNRNSEPNSA